MDATLFRAINHLAGHYDGIDDTFEFIALFALIVLLLGLWFWPGERTERDGRQRACIEATISVALALGPLLLGEYDFRVGSKHENIRRSH